MKKTPFATKFQAGLLCVLLLTFILMTQTASQTVFKTGTSMLLVLGLLQVAVGNVAYSYDFPTAAKTLGKILIIVASVFAVSMFMAPYFMDKKFVQVFLWVLIFGTVGMFVLFIFLGSGKKQKKEGN